MEKYVDNRFHNNLHQRKRFMNHLRTNMEIRQNHHHRKHQPKPTNDDDNSRSCRGLPYKSTQRAVHARTKRPVQQTSNVHN